MWVIKTVGQLLVAAVVTAGLALVALLVVVPRATGSVPLNVLTGSMSPTIPAGSVVLVKPVDPAEIQPGDVITFQRAPGVDEYVTHRVVRYQPDTEPPSFITKGDANPGEDIDPVPVGAIRGQVWFHVPYVGTAAEVVQGPAGPSLAISLAGLLLMFYVTRRLVAGGRAGSDDAEEPRHVAEAPPLTGAQAS